LEILLHKEYGDEGPKHIDGVRPSGEEEEDEEERDLPEFTEGEVISIASPSTAPSSTVAMVPGAGVSRATLDVKERMTIRPTHLSESELIGEMEKYGIGTDASISTHIENISKRNYAHLISGRKMCPSKLGLVLAQGYHSIDSSLVLPQIRSDIEDQCNKIAKGLANKVK
jgi:DNA topoisomerase-3